ncbi:hypothetical protein IPU70_12765 [Achromobacter sp. SD115]|uniref:hypothetical protein n=1 Tax=Achromobacter sp. SD115 TaxID=2782011 RepID=UPI001A963378|nr:hypothetical protein [Achromobacter sp. SD115]MBO1014426.1 hypothetical protein [Achromobacter sp. SD115]
MVLELTPQQVAGLCAIDAKGFVQGVMRDILRDYPGLAEAGLSARLATALSQARALGIDEDANLVEFLWTEALVPGFYKQPGFLAWIRKPGRPADQRFHDYMQVMKWQSRQQLRQEHRN